MGDFFYRPAIVIPGGARIDLPVPITEWETGIEKDTDIHEPALEDGGVFVSSRTKYRRIRISGLVIGAALDGGVYDLDGVLSKENSLNIIKALEELESNSFNLYRWHNRRYEKCAIESVSYSDGPSAAPFIPYSLNIVAMDPFEKVGLTGADALDAGAYEAWVGGGETGGTIQQMSAVIPYEFIFRGIAGETPASGDCVIWPHGTPGQTAQVVGIEITHAEIRPAGTGSTVIKVATGSKGSTADTITLTDSQQASNAKVTGGISALIDSDGVATTPLYVYIASSGGKHSDIHGKVYVR